MGAELGALAISHLEEVSDAGVRAMAKSGTIATVLPTTAYILRLRPPPVRRMIGSSIPIALGSDFNPNAFCFSMVRVKKIRVSCKVCGFFSVRFFNHFEGYPHVQSHPGGQGKLILASHMACKILNNMLPNCENMSAKIIVNLRKKMLG